MPRLLEDKTTGTNIIWGTDSYAYRGDDYSFFSPITPRLITGECSDVIKNYARKVLEQQNKTLYESSEIFTPLNICHRMNDDADTAWFGHSGAFDTAQVDFSNVQGHRTWKNYVDARRLEIACGEAPYIVSRYDVTTGEAIRTDERIGLLDRKLRIVNGNASDEAEWLKWTIRAFQSTYGYEFRGDNLLIARVNMLMAFEENMLRHLHRRPTQKEWLRMANIIAWNIWQMDGLTSRPPSKTSDIDSFAYSYQTSLFDIEEREKPNTENNPLPSERETPLCRIYDWRRDIGVEFANSQKGRRKMKFDFIIGNPPYQDEIACKNRAFAKHIYDKFLESAYEISDRVEMIHPAQFLFNAGGTPWNWNKKMLGDTHVRIMDYVPDSSEIFPNADIAGGIVITYRDAKKEFTPISAIASPAELNYVLKVAARKGTLKDIAEKHLVEPEAES